MQPSILDNPDFVTSVMILLLSESWSYALGFVFEDSLAVRSLTMANDIFLKVAGS